MTVTNNYSLTLPLVGGDTNLWGGELNNGVITTLDGVLGGNLAVSMTSSNVALTTSQFQNAVYTITGTLTGNLNLTVPLSPNSATVACAGKFIVNNQTTGAYTITVLTVASGSTGVTVPQGSRSSLYSDGTNVYYADDENRSTLLTYSGNPNGAATGIAGSVNTPASVLFDRANGLLYLCTTTGTVWGGFASGTITPQGYLSLNNVTSNPIVGSDTTSSSVYYTPIAGDLIPISNGTYFTLYSFTQQTLSLTASHAASNIYDVFAFLDGSTLRIGTGPSWLAGGGSVTPGSCGRGTGAGSTVLSALHGLLVNTVQITAINGGGSYTVAAGQGTYLGSIWINSVAGQTSCYVSTGQSRKWGVWNNYNRRLYQMRMNDGTSSWSTTSTVFRAANGNSNNNISTFFGVPNDSMVINYQIECDNGAGGGVLADVSIGLNSTTANVAPISRTSITATGITQYVNFSYPCRTGIDTWYVLERVSSASARWFGDSNNMCMSLSFMA